MPDLPALFRRFPEARAIPLAPFVDGPTPVDLLAIPGLPTDRLWVKRDERSAAIYGGNKPRKLEFLIGAALARRSKRLVTTGGLGTHHGLATALFGREAGLACTLVLVDQPLTAEVRESLYRLAATGAELLYGRDVPRAAWRTARVLLRATRNGERPTLIPTGGSSPTGNLGIVSAGLELADQIDQGALPEPAELFVAVGSGGTAAGLALGLRLAGLATRVVPVLVNDILPPTPRGLARRAMRTLARLRRVAPSVPPVRLRADDFRVVTRQLGPGYGAATPAAEEALAAAAAADLRLETTYTAKCLSEILARASEGTLPEAPILFWNSFDAVLAPHPAPIGVMLPEPFERIVSQSTHGPGG